MIVTVTSVPCADAPGDCRAGGKTPGEARDSGLDLQQLEDGEPRSRYHDTRVYFQIHSELFTCGKKLFLNSVKNLTVFQ